MGKIMTKNEFILELKDKNPTISIGDDEQGYTLLDEDAYNAQIEEWANVLVEEQNAKEAVQNAKETALAKLTALGLTTDDLKALGL
jgi:hypothetical protein